MTLLDFSFYIGVVKYVFSAFTAACLVGLIYAFIEQMFPNVLLRRALVTYSGPRLKLALPLIAIGALGLVVSLFLWATNTAQAATSMQYVIAFLSAVVFNVGAMMFLTSQKMQERVTS